MKVQLFQKFQYIKNPNFKVAKCHKINFIKGKEQAYGVQKRREGLHHRRPPSWTPENSPLQQELPPPSPQRKRRVRNEVWKQEKGLRNSRNPYAYLHRRAPPSDSKKLAGNLRGTASNNNNGSKSDFYRSKEKK